MNRSLFLRAAAVFVSLGFVTVSSGGETTAVPRKHVVNCQVGLSIRSKPAYEAKRLALLEDGAKVTLAGKEVEGDKTKVVPVVSKDAQDPDATWVQVAAPKAGYVLYKAGGTAPHDYLVPAR